MVRRIGIDIHQPEHGDRRSSVQREEATVSRGASILDLSRKVT